MPDRSLTGTGPDSNIDVRELVIDGLDERVRVFACGDIIDTFVVETTHFTVVIDTMISPDAIRRVVERSADPSRPLLVVNTHGDWDHVWGNALFGGEGAERPAPIIAHDLAAGRMTSPEALAYLRQSQKDRPQLYDTVRLVSPTISVGGGATIHGGDLSLVLIETPGHSPDHLAIWIPELALLLAGDAAEMPFPLVSGPETLSALRTSLEKLASLEPRQALYCHARGIASPDVIDQNIAYFNELHLRCIQFFNIRSGAKVRDATADSLAWPLEEVLPPDTSIDDLIPDAEFYRQAHTRAIQSMARWVRASR